MEDLFNASAYQSTVTARQAIFHLTNRMGRQSRMGQGAIKSQIERLDLRVDFLNNQLDDTSDLAMQNLWLRSVISTAEFIDTTKQYPYAIGPLEPVISGWYDDTCPYMYAAPIGPQPACPLMYAAPIGPVVRSVNPRWLDAFKAANGATSKMSLRDLTINGTPSIA